MMALLTWTRNKIEHISVIMKKGRKTLKDVAMLGCMDARSRYCSRSYRLAFGTNF